MTQLPYMILSGCGNNFVVIDHRDPCFSSYDPSLFQEMCQSLTSDGVLLLERSQNADFRMRIFNADGSEAEMCGNGLRCLGRFIEWIGFPPKKYTIEIGQELLWLKSDEDAVTTEMPLPHQEIKKVTVHTLHGEIPLFLVHPGVPHAVHLIDPDAPFSFDTVASTLRDHPFFDPKGTNVTFVSRGNGTSIQARIFERGVGETQACGTGAVAAAMVAHREWGLSSPIEVVMPGGSLHIAFSSLGTEILHIQQRGPVSFLSSGVWQTLKENQRI